MRIAGNFVIAHVTNSDLTNIVCLCYPLYGCLFLFIRTKVRNLNKIRTSTQFIVRFCYESKLRARTNYFRTTTITQVLLRKELRYISMIISIKSTVDRKK